MSLASVILEFIAGPEEGRKVCIAEFRPFLIGRGLQVDVRLPAVDTTVSRNQAYVELTPQECLLRMVRGSNPVITRNDWPVDGECQLTQGDVLCFGTSAAKTIARVTLVFRNFGCIYCTGQLDHVEGKGMERVADMAHYAHEECVEKTCAAIGPFGDYEVIGEMLGVGGAGSVYRVYHRASRTVWALKHLTNSEQARRFDREMYQMQSLRHPNIIRFVEGNVDGKGIPYFVMEYALGGSLTTLASSLIDGEKLDIICDVLEALKYLHVAGKVHRDLKPDNILLQLRDVALPHRQAKISDFGLLKGGDRIILTHRAKSFCGTAHFIAPEQIDGLHDVDGRADIYSAGVTLYWLLSQHTPVEWTDSSPPESIREEIQFGKRISLKHWRPDLSKHLIGIIDRACNKKPGDRFHTADDFQAEIRAYQNSARPKGPI